MVADDIQKIYLGLIGRPADAEGLAYWSEEIENGTLTLEQLRANIVNEQPEFINGPGQLSRADFVAQLYVKMFGREPDDSAEYWVTGDGESVNLDQLVLAFIDGVSDQDSVALNNRVKVSQQITDAGLSLDESSTEILQSVTNDPASVAAAEQVLGQHESGEIPESEPEPAPFPTSSGYVDNENGWYIYASVSDVDQTTSIYLRNKFGSNDGFDAVFEMEAVTYPEGYRSDRIIPGDDVLAPIFDFRYTGISNAYSVDITSSSIRVDGYQPRKINDINELTWENHRYNFDNGNDRELSVFDSPDGYDGLLEEMLRSDTMYVKIVPDNPYFPTIENGISLDGFEEMLELFDDLSVRREGNIYGNSENQSGNMLLEETISPSAFVEIA